jgi:Flp pilus assembly pilin Flp
MPKVTFYETGGGLLMALGEWFDPCAAVCGDYGKAWLSIPGGFRPPCLLAAGEHAVFDLEQFPALREPLERAMNESRTTRRQGPMKLLKNLLMSEAGQDMVEYTLLLAFIALAAGAAYVTIGNAICSIWSTAQADVTSASTIAN